MDYPTKSLSDAEIRRCAKALLDHLGLSNATGLDVLACLQAGFIWTVRGVRRLVYEVCDDSEMGADDARTEYRNRVVVILAKYSVDKDARAGIGRARFTLGHELGHAVLHDGIARARVTGAAGVQRAKWIKPFESAERQANIFATAILINDAEAEKATTAEEIVARFNVSNDCAAIYFKALEEIRGRAASAERVMKKAAAFCEQSIPDPVLAHLHLSDLCTACGKPALIQNGSKYICEHCWTAGYQFQDGDRGNY
jgi:IrrE N-terminal-like domain